MQNALETSHERTLHSPHTPLAASARTTHVSVRATLAKRYAPATTNKMLSALRGTFKAAWRLGQMATDDYQRAIDLPSVRGETLPRGLDLVLGEMGALHEVNC